MNRGLLAKSFRENWPITLGLGALMFVASLGIAFVIRQIGVNEFGAILKSDFLKGAISSFAGTLVTAELRTLLAQTLPWTDPLILIILYAHNATICTQMPAGEIDRGTIDVLMGMPVSRWQAYVCHSSVWIASGFAVLLAGVAGNWCGAHLAHDSLAPAARMTIVFANDACLYLAWGGFCCFVSSFSARRGRAVAIVIAAIVSMTLMNIAADAWETLRFLNRAAPINYFRPLFIFRDGAWPLQSMAILAAAGLAFWIAGGIIFQRRDLNVV